MDYLAMLLIGLPLGILGGFILGYMLAYDEPGISDYEKRLEAHYRSTDEPSGF